MCQNTKKIQMKEENRNVKVKFWTNFFRHAEKIWKKIAIEAYFISYTTATAAVAATNS